jgi:hypothetical protein
MILSAAMMLDHVGETAEGGGSARPWPRWSGREGPHLRHDAADRRTRRSREGRGDDQQMTDAILVALGSGVAGGPGRVVAP